MTICHLTTVHDWNDVRIYVKMCRSAVADGFDVDLVAPVAVGNPLTDTAGVRVHSLRKYRSRLVRSSLGTLRCIRISIAIRARLYHIHDPELLPAAIVLRLLQRRVVFDFHEEFSEQIKNKPYVSNRSRRVASTAARCWEFVLCLAASGVVTATPRIRDRLPIRRTQAAIVCNYPALEEFASPTRTPFEERPRVAYYVGGVSATRGSLEMIEAGRILAGSGTDIAVRIAGPFESRESERRLRRAASHTNAYFLGRRTREEVMRDLDAARVGLVVLRRTSNYVNALPVKLFEYMAAGVPVVASDFPLWTEIVKGADCGLTVDPGDPAMIAEAIAHLVDDTDLAESMGASGRRAVETQYHWNSQWQNLRQWYGRGAGHRGTRERSQRTV